MGMGPRKADMFEVSRWRAKPALFLFVRRCQAAILPSHLFFSPSLVFMHPLLLRICRDLQQCYTLSFFPST